MRVTVKGKRVVKINKDELDWYKDRVAIQKYLVFLGRLNNLNGNMFYRTFPYWNIDGICRNCGQWACRCQ